MEITYTMTYKIHLIILLWLASVTAGSQIVLNHPLSARQTYYNMEVKLDTAGKIISGNMETYWVNKSSDKVPDVRLHLYLNAFKSNRTTFNREERSSIVSKEAGSGWINILSLSDRQGNDLLNKIRYISPDDGNRFDSTVISITLGKPANPGDTVFLKIFFESKLPGKIVRTGYKDNFYFAGQWFPKFGVYEPAGMRYATAGGWNCHQFHNNSEFYSDHSVYDVKITVPKNYVVGSGGLLIKEAANGPSDKTLTYRAEDIVDFAWTAWPGYAVYTDKWKHVNITLLMPPQREDQVQRQMRAVKNALEYFDLNVGPYPWPHLTFVDPPNIGDGAGGMEYTTLFTSVSFTGMPAFLHFPEMVTIHEFGHAYFMGMLASNEAEEPWLDEGVNQFWETRIMDHYYGANNSLLDHSLFSLSDKTFARSSYVYSDSRQIVTNNEYSWNYPHDTYGMMSYFKTAVCLRTLMGIVGEETTNDIFREYYKRWAFRHPSGKDFIDVVNEVVKKKYGNRFGSDMNWFFDQTLFGTGICDYKVSHLINTRIIDEKVASDSTGGASSSGRTNDSLYTAVVELERLGDVKLPVDVLIHFKNGKEITESWDGFDRFKDFRYEGKGKVEWAKIDPEYKIAMDVNMINNSITLDPDRVPVKRIVSKTATILQLLINLITL
jgi:hypothetical protein